MADREKVIKALHCRAYDDDFPCSICAYYRLDEKHVAKCDYRELMDDAISLLKEQDAVVRCKDCRHYTGKDCNYNDIFPAPREDWYCADGDRRQKNE